MSLHRDALSSLSSWTPGDAGPTGDPRAAEAQTQLRDRFVAHLRARPDGTDRSSYPDHLTAGALVLSGDGHHVLLNLHRQGRRWFAFGGHCEPGDQSLAGAALREAREESGLTSLRLDPVPVHLDEHAVDFCGSRGTVHHLDVRYAALAPEGLDEVAAASAESLDVRWWPVDALPQLEEEMHTLIRLARRRLA